MKHPKYNVFSQEYDFQVLHLGGWVSDKNVVALNSNSTIPEGSTSNLGSHVLTLIGMGRTDEVGQISDVLQKTTINHVVDPLDCQYSYPEYLVNGELVICMTGEDSSQGRDRYV
jgi:hypothetical protein